MDAAANKHFGPIAPVIPYSIDAAAFELETRRDLRPLRLGPHKDIAQACRIADGIDTGVIHINDQPIDDKPHVPFGGMKQIAVNRT